MKNSIKVTLAALALLSTSATFAEGDAHAKAAAGDAAKGKEKSAVCAACHGADGNSANPAWPKLAGQHPSYIEKQLADFKEKRRNDPTMSPMAMPLSEQDMKDLAAYFSSQQSRPGSANAEKVAMGESIYKGGNLNTGVTACAACHGPTGKGNPASIYPSIGGQHVAYTVKQLKDFKAMNRENDPSEIMRDIAKRMTETEMEAVSEYMAGLH